MPAIWLTMRGIHSHYASVAVELAPPPADQPVTLPSSNRAIVLVSKLHLPTLRALAYAGRPSPATSRPSRSAWTTPRPPGCAKIGRARHPGAADRRRLAVPRHHQAGRVLCQPAAQGEPARRGHRVHPRVRARALVGAVAAQPERAAAEGQAAACSQASSSPACPISSGRQARRAGARRRPRRGPPGGRFTKIEVKPARRRCPQQPGGRPRGRCTRAGWPGSAPHRHRARADPGRGAAGQRRRRRSHPDRRRSPTASRPRSPGTLRTVTVRPRGNSPTLQAELWDGSGSLTLVWLGRREHPGNRAGTAPEGTRPGGAAPRRPHDLQPRSTSCGRRAARPPSPQR